MSKKDDILGISVSHGILSMTLMKNGHIKQSVHDEIPDNIVDGVRILASHLFSDFIRDKLSEHGIKCRNAAYVIADEDVFKRIIRLPDVDDAQIRLNIPFEFRDYIRGELKNYAFDYVKRRHGEEDGDHIRILAYAVAISKIEEIREILDDAGLRLMKLVPEASIFEALLNSLEDEEEVNKERCILDIGKGSIRILIFKNGEYKLSHPIDGGEAQIIRCIADEHGVDMHLAETYYRTNYQNCNDAQTVQNAAKDISIDVMRGLNFYEISDMKSRLNDVVVCGTGARSDILIDILKTRIDKKVISMDELFPKYEQGKNFNLTYASVGVLISGDTNMFSEHTAAETGRKKVFKWVKFAIGMTAIAIAAAIFSKHAIYDRYQILSQEKAKTETLKQQLELKMDYIEDSQEMLDKYAHYTYEDFTDEEKGRTRRLKVAKLADVISEHGGKVNEFNLMGDTLFVTVTADSLESVGSLAQVLSSEDIVDSCSVQVAETNDVNSSDRKKRNGNAESEQAILSVPSVTAEINIYLKSGIKSDKGAGKQ